MEASSAVSGLHARLERTWTRWTGWIARRDGRLTRRVRWPISAWAPCYRRELHLARRGALGDVLMCTPALRELHRINPRAQVTFYTDFPDLIRTVPGVCDVRPYDQRSRFALEFVYESSVPPLRHIAKIMGDCIGVDVRNVRPVCPPSVEISNHWRTRLAQLPRPIVVVNRSAGPFTPNKDWPASYWSELVERLCRSASVVETGATASTTVDCRHERFLDLRGHTTIPELVGVIASANLHVGPISGPVHIAAALGVPSVVIYGGYENPVCSKYSGNVNFYTQLHCSPCWLRDGCPYDRQCLGTISPATVGSAVLRVLASS